MNANRKTKAGKGSRPKPSKGARGRKAKSNEQPLAQSRSFKTSSPRVREVSSAGQRSCTIRHSELFASIPSTTSFDVTIYPLNPGQSVVFPWLSVQAQGWERYRFKKLEFEFLSRTAATTNGSVTMAVDYDASDPSPNSELQMMSYQNSTQDAPWKNQRLVCSPMSLSGPDKYRYVRTTNTPPTVSAELRQDDAGKLYVCAIGGTVGANFGTMIAHYEVEFVTPQAPTGGTPSNSKILGGITSISPQAIFGTDATVLGTIATTMQSLGTPGAVDQGTRFIMDGLLPGNLYQAALGVLGANFVSLTPWTFSPGVVASNQAAMNFTTGNAYTIDFIADSRTAHIDFVPESATATITPGTALFSVLNQVNPDIVE